MTDQSITAVISAVTGATVYAQAAAVAIPLPLTAMLTIASMGSAALVTWGVFKKSAERNEAEIAILREQHNALLSATSDIRERLARIEGKLERDHHN